MQERKDICWPKPSATLDIACHDILKATKIEAFSQQVVVHRLSDKKDPVYLDLAGRCSAQEYFALLKESKGPVIRDKLLEDWRQSLVILGDGLDYFRAAMVECSSDFPEAGFTTFYVKNQGDLDWEAIGNELELPADLRWGNGQEGLSDNWLSFSTEKISGITEPWLYIGPGFAGMHQEDGVMNSYNVSVPVSVLPSTDKMLRQHGIDFLKATKVWQFSPSTIQEEDLLGIRKMAGFDNTDTLNDRCSWRQLWGRTLILETDTRWAQSAGHLILTRGQVHSTLSSGGINLAWNKACGSDWPARARDHDKRIFDAVGKDNDNLELQEDDVPTTFPTDTIIHLAAMALVKQGRAALHPDIVAGVLKTWLPWVREDLKLLSDSSSTTQASPMDLEVRCSRCWRQTLYIYTMSEEGMEFCWSCSSPIDRKMLVHTFPLQQMREWVNIAEIYAS